MIIAIVLARVGSTRLPGKAMMEVNGRPLLGHLLDRVGRSECVDKVVVAAPTASENDALCEYAASEGFDIFRGSEQDVLERTYKAAEQFKAEVVVRITADCPLMDYKVIDNVVQFYKANTFDYVSNIYPRTYPDGMDVEVFSFKALKQAFEQAEEKSDREHVTTFIYKSGRFSVGALKREDSLAKERWTLDFPEDFALIKTIFEGLGKDGHYFDMDDILNYKKENPEVFKQNQHLGVG